MNSSEKYSSLFPLLYIHHSPSMSFQHFSKLPVLVSSGVLEGLREKLISLLHFKARCFKAPFGFNTNGKLIMWLGDIDDMDDKTKGILKQFNVPSDHLLIDSEFYQAQMKCIFSEPIIEKES